ncbi:heat-inducible transcription repressor HrcA [Candidatus Desantisbacteria bacterium]|nr:heat-inducible transcription repressor HrcA [Candidatus Desantisbacteria bacterium]
MDLCLDERSKKIFQAIVQNYIKTAEPVGSRTIARHYNLGISPATIRNVMNDLEEMGLITQPHTSAGRIPTHKGYRFYVDSLMERSKLTKHEEENIQIKYNDKTNEYTDEIFHLTSKLLSAISNYAGVAIAPITSKSKIKKIEFINVSSKKILMILITDSNQVKNKIIDISEEISSDELHIISKMFTDKLKDSSLYEIRNSIKNEILLANKFEINKPEYNELFKKTIHFAESCLNIEVDKDIYLEGAANILKHPEFSKINKTKDLIKLFEEKKDLFKIVARTVETDGAKVYIGEENNISEMNNCSVVICSYKVKNLPGGIIGIIGPTRMKYGKIFSIVEYTSFQLENILKLLID